MVKTPTQTKKVVNPYNTSTHKSNQKKENIENKSYADATKTNKGNC